uniref:Uncharacterized protein n=1 Tax=Romanomermis culicivorax TaxID=13658 RepID=A0A915IJM9_ROMCU
MKNTTCIDNRMTKYGLAGDTGNAQGFREPRILQNIFEATIFPIMEKYSVYVFRKIIAQRREDKNSQEPCLNRLDIYLTKYTRDEV